MPVKTIIVNRLFESFAELERAILSAKETLTNKQNAPVAVLERIESYEGILNKQRSLAMALCRFASAGNWDEVSRHVKLINGLSAMIRDDAREVLAGAQVEMSAEQRELSLS